MMDASLRATPDQYRSRAARFRRLAADATTAQARRILLDLARQHDALAVGSEDPSAVADARR